MTLILALSASTSFLFHLANPAARSLAVALMVALALAAFRRSTTSFRLFTWTAVLYSALAMPLLLWMLPPLRVPAPLFLQTGLTPKPEISSQYQLAGVPFREFVSQSAAIQPPVQIAPTHAIASGSVPSKSIPADRSIPFALSWAALGAALYLVIAFVLLLRFSIGLVFARKLTRASQAIDDPRLLTKLRVHAASLTRIPRAAESELISVPLTMGVRHSTILLPGDWREWDDPKLNAVLAHEVSHVARRDALTQRLSLLHRAIFWFSPLAWWLHRHLAALAEQASDEAALSCGADRKDYAKTLLGFFAALQTPLNRVWWQGVAMAKPGQAEQRVERILSWKGSVPMYRKTSHRPIAIATLICALPVLYLAASAHPVSARAAQAPTSTSAPTMTPSPVAAPNPQDAPSSTSAPASAPDDAVDSNAPTPPALPAAPRAGVAAGVRGSAPIAPIATIAPVGPVAQVAPVAPEPPSHHGFSYHYGFDDDQRFVIVSGKTDSFTMSGSS
ncbi:MAG TPA: M56 family metallopeptidase, partial [Candidatus Sulfotelmatobacter sp.]|nr:M56 family metallopeptidase [Candidatus Sulfotelmatobacter sp.]